MADTLYDAAGFGVCLFYLLSAYLITELLLREQETTGRVRLSAFYLRRILRIWPLYFGFLALVGVVGIFCPRYHLSWGLLLCFVLMLGNWYSLRFGVARAIAPLWSISVEEQFYVAWPLIAKAWGRRGVLGVCLAAWCSSVAALYYLAGAKAAPVTEIWENSFVQFQFFAGGGLLALWLRGRAGLPGNAWRLPLFGAGLAAWLIASGVFHCRRPDFHGSQAAMIAGYSSILLGCILLFVAVLGLPSSSIPHPLRYLGKISYGLYVFHDLTIDVTELITGVLEPRYQFLARHHGAVAIAKDATALLLTIGIAALSYRFLESPFLNLKQRFTVIHSRNT